MTYTKDLIEELQAFGYKNIFTDFHPTEDAFLIVCPSTNLKKRTSLRIAVDRVKAVSSDFTDDLEQLECIVKKHQKKNIKGIHWIK